MLTLAVLASAAPAQASVALALSPVFPSTVTVGDAGRAGSLSITNASNGGDAASSVTLGSIDLVPSCGVDLAICNDVNARDPGVFRLSSSAIGRVGTACANVSFTTAIADANSGRVHFTPSTPVVLQQPTSASSSCTIDFTFDVLKTPLRDADPALPGLQTYQEAAATATSSGGLPGSGTGSGQTTVVPAPPPPSVGSGVGTGGVVSGVVGGGGTVPTATTTRFSLDGRAKLGKDGSATFSLNVPGAGAITAWGTANIANHSKVNRVCGGHVKSTKAGKVSLKVKPNRAGRKQLRRKGRLKTTVLIIFEPGGRATPTVVTPKVTLHLKR